MTLWWVGNLVLVLALPIVLVEAFRIIRSLSIVRGAAQDIAGSLQTVSRTVPPVMGTLAGIAGRCRDLDTAVVRTSR
jgi:hypothetical protein